MTDNRPGYIPLSAASVAFGIKPDSAKTMARQVRVKPTGELKQYYAELDKETRRQAEGGVAGRFPVKVDYDGRYQVCRREDVLAHLEGLPHLTEAEYNRILAAHKEAGGRPQHTGTESAPVAVLSSRERVTVSEIADLLKVTTATVHHRHKMGTLGFDLEKDGGRLTARSLDAAAWLRSHQRAWPSVAEFAEVRTLDLMDIAESVGEPRHSPSRRTVLEYLDARPKISIQDFAVATLPAGENFDRYHRQVKYSVTKGQIPTETEPLGRGQRVRRWIQADEARKAIQEDAQVGE